MDYFIYIKQLHIDIYASKPNKSKMRHLFPSIILERKRNNLTTWSLRFNFENSFRSVRWIEKQLYPGYDLYKRKYSQSKLQWLAFSKAYAAINYYAKCMNAIKVTQYAYIDYSHAMTYMKFKRSQFIQKTSESLRL